MQQAGGNDGQKALASGLRDDLGGGNLVVPAATDHNNDMVDSGDGGRMAARLGQATEELKSSQAALLSTSGQQQSEKRKQRQTKEKNALSTSGQQVGKILRFRPAKISGQHRKSRPLSTGGQQKKELADDPTKPPKPALASGIQADVEWRGSANRLGVSFTLWFRPYTVQNRRRVRGRTEYVLYLNAEQWERMKGYDRDKQRRLVQAEFDGWYAETRPALTANRA